ncbi:MAG: hypothetical protein LBN35_02720, partial [Clostridiales Family XIII bacterium]|nr:hypothetical protein [Clostridiales Family XIII bacterium]
MNKNTMRTHFRSRLFAGFVASLLMVATIIPSAASADSSVAGPGELSSPSAISEDTYADSEQSSPLELLDNSSNGGGYSRQRPVGSESIDDPSGDTASPEPITHEVSEPDKPEVTDEQAVTQTERSEEQTEQEGQTEQTEEQAEQPAEKKSSVPVSVAP